MSDYQGPQPGTGFLWPNKYHQKGDKQPCLKGTVNVNGVELEVAVWAPKEGKKSYFMKIAEKEDRKPDQSQPEGWQDSKNPVQQQQQSAPPPAERKKNMSGLMK